jgi:hypothetical protein
MATYLIMHTTAFWQYRFPVLLSLQGLTIGGLLVMYFAQGAGAVLIALICVAFLAALQISLVLRFKTRRAKMEGG